MRLGGVSNRPDRVQLAYRENVRAIEEQGLSMALADRMRWALKLGCAAAAPRLFLSLQNLSWRLRRRL
jgi:hypothetical protein